jgi:transposase InsO family protein
VLAFHKNNGTAKTIEAYGIPKPTVYRWKKTLDDNEGKLNSLIPKSTAPKRKREMFTDYRIVEWLQGEREAHPVGKGILKPLLDEYCQSIGIKSPSESLIGKIIKRRGIFPKIDGRIYHNPNSKCARRKPNYKQKVKKSPKPTEFGYVEIDTIAQFNLGMKRYIFNAIDVRLKFKFSYPYKTLNARNGKDFVEKLEQVYPIKGGIKIVQTDNGLEFMGEFDRYLKQKNINHLFIYPRCPKINGYIERANRTLKQEFLNPNKYLLFEDMEGFTHKLMEHLVWYNTKRIHQSLGKISPMDYLLKTAPESQMYVTRTRA